MRHTPERHTDAVDRTLKNVRRKTRKRYSSEDKIRIVLAGFIESQSKLRFAAFIKEQTERAVSFHITPGQMEQLPRMDDAAKLALRDFMRQRYAVHYSELNASHQQPTEDGDQSEEVTDTDEPMEW